MTTQLQTRALFSLVPACAAVLLATACGGGGGGGGGAPGGPDPVADSLNALGVATATTPREQEPAMAVADDYSPFGSRWEADVTNELVVMGFETGAMAGSPFTIIEVTDASNGNAVNDVLFAQTETEAPWAVHDRSANPVGPLRSATPVDFDGDGFDEIVVVYMQGNEVRLSTIQDQSGGFAKLDAQIGFEADISDVEIAAGDFDGDGVQELVLGYVQARNGVVMFLRFDAAMAQFVEVGTRKMFTPTLMQSRPAFEFATGNIDFDRSDELAVVFNETNDGSHCVYAVYDDLAGDFMSLSAGTVTAPGSNGAPVTAVGASVSIGDIDGDNLGEIVFGGLKEFTSNCNRAPYLMVVLDDREHGTGLLSSHEFTDRYPGCGSGRNPRIWTAHTHTLDIDGDGVQEIVVNRFVFEDFMNEAPWTLVPAYELPIEVTFDNGFNQVDRNTSSWAVGDFTGDNREDIAVIREDQQNVRIFGVTATATAIAELRTVPVLTGSSQNPDYPIILPVNVDVDGPVLMYSEAEYKLVFSEPVVMAALAAAPYRDGIGQNVGSCFTSFGNTTSTGSSSERSVSVRVSASVGVNLDGGALTQSEFELKDTLTVQSTRKTGSAYSLAKSIIFNSAPSEDTVVFTSVPIDQYHYTITSHPDASLIATRSSLACLAIRSLGKPSAPSTTARWSPAARRLTWMCFSM